MSNITENTTEKNQNSRKKAFDTLSANDIMYSNSKGVKKTIHGALAISELFGDIAKEVRRNTEIEIKKPKYRFLAEQSNDMPSMEIIDRLDELNDKLRQHDIAVEVLENIDCKDVTSEERYMVRIGTKNHIFVDLSLLKYREMLLDFDFNAEEYIEGYIQRIFGCSNNKTKEITDLVVDYLSYIIYFKKLYILTYKKIGWDRYDWDGLTRIFKYDKIMCKDNTIKGRAVPRYAEGLELCKDDSEDNRKRTEFILFTRQLLNRHKHDALILGAGISGLLRDCLSPNKETNINMNIMGEPASGKSTIGHFLLSFFGDIQKLEGASIDTDNAMEEIRARRSVLPYVLDERMLKVYGQSDKEKKKTVLLEIFREYEGKVKERLGKQYEEFSGDRIKGPIISSSVESVFNYARSEVDLGQYRRFIEFNIGKPENEILFNKEEAEKADKMASTHYGYGVRIIVDYMIELLSHDDSIFEKRFSRLNEIISGILAERQEDEKLSGMKSSSQRFALVLLSYQTLREALLYDLYNMAKTMNNDANSYTINIEESTEEVVEQTEVTEEPKAGDESYVIDFENEDTEQAFEKLMDISDKYDSFEKYAKEEEIIKDYSIEIVDILIDNLVNKLHNKNLTEKPQNKLLDYITTYKDDFFWCEKPGDGWVGPKDKYIGRIVNKGDVLEINFVAKYHLEKLMFKQDIPTPDQIRKYIRSEEADRKNMLKLWESAKDAEIDNYVDKNPEIQFDRNKQNPRTYVKGEKQLQSKLIFIKVGDITEDSEKDE